MISGDYRKHRSIWQDDTIKVEKPHRSFDRHEDDTETIIIDIPVEEDSEESESETEESFYYSDASETFAWFDNEKTVTANGEIEITLKRVVNKNIISYNKRGELQEVKPKPHTIKII